ncbi:unnamed protein product [Owenia fusiformis]|uniref:Uncharacterized protein n=1 Tax=Owenia fusiformis TaxID=6347 RepID=A0A8S4PX90_OWEFU|nr:unnamed protein product [Owenia fusiformis]
MKTLLMGSWRRESKGHIIVTTRREPIELQQDIRIEESACVPVGPFTMEESISFMVKRSGYSLNECLQQLVQDLGFLPLALEQAAVHIKQRKYSYEVYLREFQQKRLKWLKKEATAPHAETSKERLAVKMTWKMNFEYVEAISEEEDMGNTASVIMKVMPFLHADDIPIEVINEGNPPVEDEDLSLNLSSSVDIKEAVSVLTKFSLFTKCTQNSLSVHRLVQEVIRDQLSRDCESGHILKIAVSMLNKALDNTDSPKPIITGVKKNATNRVSLNLWSRLALQACSLRDHVKQFNGRKGRKGSELLISEPILRIIYESSIFHSVNQRQSEALCAQGEKNTMMTYLDSLDQGKIEFYIEVKIPILEDQRKRIEECMKSESSVIKDQTKSDELRGLGNTNFKDGNFHAAISCYTESINIATEETSKVLSNRSLSYLRKEEYEKCLQDANSCLSLDFESWKANCWKSYALHNLWRIETDQFHGALQPMSFEPSVPQDINTSSYTRSMGYAAAAMASYQHPESSLEYKMKLYYPIINYCVVHDTMSLQMAWLPTNRPYTTIFLQPNTYTTPLITMQSTQMVGLSPTGVHIVVQPGRIANPSKDVRNIHFENLNFKGHQIMIFGGEVASFINCSFANGEEACDEYPFCKGGNGCKSLTANECLQKSESKRKELLKNFARFASGEINKEQFCDGGLIGEFARVGERGSPGLAAGEGGVVIVRDSHFNRCGGGGMLVDGRGSFGEMDGCIVESCRQDGIEVRNGGSLIVNNCDIKNNHNRIIG